MAARSPSSVKVGGMRMSITATSGQSRSTEARSALGFAHGVGDHEATVGQQLHEPVAQDAESSAMATRMESVI